MELMNYKIHIVMRFIPFTEKIRRNKMEFVRFLVGSVFPNHCIQTLTNELSYLVKSFIVTEFHKIFN